MVTRRTPRRRHALTLADLDIADQLTLGWGGATRWASVAEMDADYVEVRSEWLASGRPLPPLAEGRYRDAHGMPALPYEPSEWEKFAADCPPAEERQGRCWGNTGCPLHT